MSNPVYTIEHDGPYLVVRFDPGTELTPAIIRRALHDELAAFRPGDRGELWDLRGCTISAEITGVTMEPLVTYAGELLQQGGLKARSAFVYQPTQAHFTRVHRDLTRGLPQVARYFLDRKEAMAWLRETERDPE